MDAILVCFGDVPAALFPRRTAHGFESFDRGTRPLVVRRTITDGVRGVSRGTAFRTHESKSKKIEPLSD